MLGEVLTATVTPFDAEGAVDYESYRELCAYLVDNGSDGVVVSGTTGESPTLSDDERVELLRAAIDAVGDRATVLAGTGTNSTAHSIHLTEQAHEAGADGFLVVTPYYNKPPREGVIRHFKAVASAPRRSRQSRILARSSSFASTSGRRRPPTSWPSRLSAALI